MLQATQVRIDTKGRDRLPLSLKEREFSLASGGEVRGGQALA